MRRGHQEQLAAVTLGVSWRPFRVTSVVYIRATLRHFERKVRPWVKMASLIPCERRLAKMEISLFQELTFGARFGNRDYGRPFTHFSVTLRCFD